MAYSDKYKLIFVHVAKNAGTSIINSLGMKDEGHIPPSLMRMRYGSYRWHNYTKFAVVRNSWDRFISSYIYARKKKSYWHSDDGSTKYGLHPDYHILKNKSIEETIKLLKRGKLNHQGWDLQVNWLSLNGEIITDKLLKLNNLKSDFNAMCDDLNIDCSLRQDNVIRKKKDYKKYFTNKTKNEIYKLYKKDIKAFNFKY